MKRWLVSLIFSTSAVAAEAPTTAAHPKDFHVCLEDKQIFHLYNLPGQENGSHPGILVEFLRSMARKFNVQLDIIRRPATACRVLMKAGTVDAYGIISHTTEREDWAVYPRTADGQLDPTHIFNRAGYFLYSRQDKDLPWDGKNLESLKGLRIGSSEGYSINDELKKAGVIVESFKSLEAMYLRLQEKQLDGVALHSNRIDKKLTKMAVKKYEQPLKMNDYYFTFSKGFHQEHKAFCEKVWKESINYEQTPEGRKLMEKYESLIDFPSR